MLQARADLCLTIQNGCNAWLFFNNGAHRFLERCVVEIDVRNLVIGDGENAARAAIEHFPAKLLFNCQPALLAENAVKVDGSVHWRDPIFGQHDHPYTGGPKKIDQIAHNAIDGGQILVDLWIFGTQSLEVVIKMRKINEAERRMVTFFDPAG